MKPFTRNRFHYNWHWIWDTGNGDIGNQAIHEIDIARWGLGVRFPVQVSAMGGHFMFDDDQETPNTLNATFAFEEPQGKRKMMELEVRHWITNHEAEIGTNAYGAGGIPPAGLTKKPEDKQFWARKMLTPTPSAISSTDQTVTWQSMDTMPTRPGSRIRSSLGRPAKHPAITGQTSSIAFAAGAPKISIVRLRKVTSRPLWCTWPTPPTVWVAP